MRLRPRGHGKDLDDYLEVLACLPMQNIAHLPRTFKELRFTVGEPAGLRSCSYKAWQHNASFYIKCRESGPGDMKVSLHPDVSLVGWQEKWARANPGALLPADHPSRVSFIATPARPGLTRVLTIVIPDAAVNWRKPFNGEELVWLPRPGRGRAIEIVFVLVSTPITLPSDSLIGCIEGDGPDSPDLLVAYREVSHDALLAVTGSLATPDGERLTDSREIAASLPDMRGFGMGQKGDGSWFLEEVAVTHESLDAPDADRSIPRH